MPSDYTVLKKAESALADLAESALADLVVEGGYLKPEWAQSFIRQLVEQSPLLRLSTVVPLVAPKQQVADVMFDAKPFVAEVRLSDDALWASDRCGDLGKFVLTTMADVVSRDVEDLVVNGDTNSADSFLARLNGALKQVTSNVVDAAGAAISGSLFRDMLKRPSLECLRKRKALRFLTSAGVAFDYRAMLLGSTTFADGKDIDPNAPSFFSGVPVQVVPSFLDDLGPEADQTVVLLCDPKNIRVGIWQQIRFEMTPDVSEGDVGVAALLFLDAKYADEPHVVKAVGVRCGSKLSR